jgi:carboxyvinyl-carboxyphosphonate phosphorylmutase
MFAGSVASMVVLGAPDIVLITLTEFAEQVRRICRATDLPLMCDADHGYGNALNVKRTVEELETAGICAITIEDTLLPMQYGESAGKGLISIEEGIGKMQAARAGRRDPNLVIAGRTSALALSTVEDTIARMKAYEAAGVDVIFLAGAKTRAQVDAVSNAIKIPLLLGWRRRRTGRQGLPRLPRRAHLPARPECLSGLPAGDQRNLQGAARRREAVAASKSRVRRSGQAHHARG